MKKLVLLAGLLIVGKVATAQNGLEGIVVEKYYVSNAADSADAADNFAVAPLRAHSVTYRVYANLLPGYKFIQMYGTAAHPLKVTTTTDFYNDPNYGSTFPQGTTLNNTKKNTTLIDSWFSVGGVCSGKMGVLKSEDTDGTIGNNQSILANDDTWSGVPIMGTDGKDGLAVGTPIAPNVLGITSELDVFDQTVGDTFIVTNGAIAALGGVEGVTASNMVLLGQFTTDGTLKFELNIQIGTPTAGESQLYVANSPTGDEISIPTLTFESEPYPTSTEGLNELAAIAPEVLVFPNPTNGNITLSVKDLKDAFVYNVTDLQGSVVKNNVSVAGSNQTTVDISGLTSGVYFVNVTVNGATTTSRIIKR